VGVLNISTPILIFRKNSHAKQKVVDIIFFTHSNTGNFPVILFYNRQAVQGLTFYVEFVRRDTS